MSELLSPQYTPAKAAVQPHSPLDSNGELHGSTSPPMEDQKILEALRLMMLGRAFDSKCFSLQRQGKLGTFARL